MGNEEQVDRILEEILNTGSIPEEACRDWPELLPEVRERWVRLRAVQAQVDALFPDPDAAPLRPVEAALPLAVLGRYEVRRPLGSGGFADAYLGYDQQLDRPVALKVLRTHGDPERPEAQSYLQEARRLARLRHPGIVTVHDFGVYEGRAYLVTDYVDGPQLGRWLREARPAWPVAARLAAEVAGALAHAHARLVVHRDVKPSNIILTEAGMPVLVDFGLALDEERAGGGERGVMSGTPWYMSPEQAGGEAHRIDGRTDIYSLGVVLYEMLTGRVPFRASGPIELLRQVRYDDPQPPRQLVGNFPPELERACLKAMAKRQQDRYASAADFADDLRRVLLSAHEAPVAPPAPSPAPPAPSPAFPAAAASAARTARGRLDAERRQVTVLVCGSALFESADFRERVDAEDQVQIRRGFRQACREPLRRLLGGTVVQEEDRDVIACFGYPVAFEDSARRAARAGLWALEELSILTGHLRLEHHLELRPWACIHSGPVVAETTDETVLIAGEARDGAARMSAVAVPDHLVCSADSQRLIRDCFDCATLDHQDGSVASEPFPVFVVRALGKAADLALGSRGASAWGPARLTPLTGRDRELELLKDRWEQAREGIGQVLQLVGEAGMGKSRLADALERHVLERHASGEAPDATVVQWKCAALFAGTGLYPAVDFFDRLLGPWQNEQPGARRDRLASCLDSCGLTRPDRVAVFAALLSLPSEHGAHLQDLSPARKKEETFAALQEWLQACAERRPVLFIVEDLHWADASTLEFLCRFLADGPGGRILALLTFRPEFPVPWPLLPRQTSLALTPLTRRQVGAFVRGQAGCDVAESVVTRIYERAGGVPLFVEEFTTMAGELGALTQGGEGAPPPDASRSIAPPSAALPVAPFGRDIPQTLQDLLMARLDRMAGAREVAQIAATLGREFSADVLGEVARLDAPALQAQLDHLVHAGILCPAGLPPRRTFRFKHVLLEDAMYNTLTRSVRRTLHGSIAGALEARFDRADGPRPEVIAHHFTEAGLNDKAAEYWLKAGTQSWERSAIAEAIAHLTRGLSLLKMLPESTGRDARELRFLGRLGTAYMAERGYAAPEAGEVFRKACGLCRRVGQPPELFAAHWGLWAWHVVRGDFRVCKDLADEARELAGRLGDDGILMEALFMQGLTALYRGELTEARDRCGLALAAYDDRERTRSWAAQTGQDAGVTQRCYLSLVLWQMGFSDQAAKLSREAVELARKIEHPVSLVFALHHAAWLHEYCRQAAQVRSAAQEQVRVATRYGFVLWHAAGRLYEAAGLLLQGRTDEGLAPFVEAIDAYRATGARLGLTHYLGILAAAHTRSGRLEQAERALDEAMALAEEHDERFHQAELYRLRGELRLAGPTPDFSGAEDCFGKALETARRQGSRAWELRAAMSLGRLMQRQGRGSEARTVLSPVFDTFDEGIATPDLVDARALLQSFT